MGEKDLDGAELFIRAAADITIENGLVVWRMQSGNYHFALTATPAVLPEIIHRTTKVWEDFRRSNGAEVIKLPKGKKRKRKHD